MHGHIVAVAHFLCAIFVPWMVVELAKLLLDEQYEAQNENAVTWTAFNQAGEAIIRGRPGTPTIGAMTSPESS